MSNIDVIGYQKQSRVFTAANVSAKALTAVATAMTGLILYNPFGSGKKLVLLDAGFASSAVGTGVGNIGLAIANSVFLGPTSLTAVAGSPLAADGSGAGSVARAYDVATFVAAPVACRWMGGNIWVTGGTGDHPYMLQDKIDGAIAVAPGAAVMFTIVTTVMTGLSSFTYVEVDM